MDLRELQGIEQSRLRGSYPAFSRNSYNVFIRNEEWGPGASAVEHSGVFLQWLKNSTGVIECSDRRGGGGRFGEIFCVPPEIQLDCRWTAGRGRLISVDYEAPAEDELAPYVIGLREFDLKDLLDIPSGFVRAAMARLEHEVVSPTFGSDIMIDALLTSMIVELHRVAKRTPDRAKGAAMSGCELARLRELIHATDGPMLPLAELARACGLPARRLAEMVREHTGMTLRALVADERIHKARTMLRGRDMLVKQVAYACGFTSPAAFTAAFHKATGQTPEQFRAR